MQFSQKHFDAIEALKGLLEGNKHFDFNFGTGIIEPRETEIHNQDFADTFDPGDCFVHQKYEYEDGLVIYVVRTTVNGSVYESSFNETDYLEWQRRWPD